MKRTTSNRIIPSETPFTDIRPGEADLVPHEMSRRSGSARTFQNFSKISAALQPHSLERHRTHTRRKRSGTPARAARIPLKTKFHFPPSALRRNGRPERCASPLSFDRRYLSHALRRSGPLSVPAIRSALERRNAAETAPGPHER